MQLGTFDRWCEVLFTNADSKENLLQIRNELNSLNRVEGIPDLRFLMENSQSSYTHFYCTQLFNSIVTEGWNLIPQADRANLRDWMSAIILTVPSKYERYVVTALMQCLARLTKFGWLEEEEYTKLPERIADVMVRNAVNGQNCVMGLRTLHMIVTEVNTMQPKRPVAMHRKVSHAFRDAALLPMFTVSLETISRQGNDDDVMEAALALACVCLNYDFAGLFMEDLGDDTGHTQIPTTWRDVCLMYNPLQMLWDVYKQTKMTDALRSLTLLGSVRRTFFSGDDERKSWLTVFLDGILDVVQNQIGLDDTENFLELCRMHAKLKSTYQLVDLIACRRFEEWIRVMADVTFFALRQWQKTFSCLHTLLTFWSRLAASQPYAPGNDATSILVNIIPSIARAFFESCLNISEVVESNRDTHDNPLADIDSVLLHLEPIPGLVRLAYVSLGTFLAEMMESAMMDMTNTPPGIGRDITYAKLTWLTYSTSLVIRTSSSTGSSSHDTEWKDGDLGAVVFRLVQLTLQDASDKSDSRIRMEIAIMHFLQSFRIIHIGDNSTPVTKVHLRISELLGPDFQDVFHTLDFFAQKIIFNIRCWWQDTKLLEDSLQLFTDLANGFHSGRQLLELGTVRQLCEAHCNGTTGFDFLNTYQTSKHRTKYYRALTTLFFMDSCSEDAFASFMNPVHFLLETVREDVRRVHSRNESLNSQNSRLPIIYGVLRDLRGVCLACTSRKTFSIFFEWLNASYMDVLLDLAQVCYSQPDVATSLYKFFADLVFNRQQRIAFDSNSPSGLLLFKGASRFVQIMAQHFVSAWPHVQTDDQRHVMNKHITQAMNILHRLLAGGYCNFGVFLVYNDPTLVHAIDAIFTMIDCGVSSDLFQYPKVSLAYFGMIDVLANLLANALCDLSSQRFMTIIHSIEAALQYPGNARGVVAHAANALHHLTAYIYTQVTRKSPQLDLISQHMNLDTTVFSRILDSGFNTILYDETTNLWNMSRPLLPLILLCQSTFDDIRSQYMDSCSPDKRQAMSEAWNNLMEKIDKNLDTKNKDRFTQNITMFKHAMKGLI
eukprot:PhF_6_TR37462/c0_g1_i2/m.55138/K18460/XPO7, EXP7; exportin-7